jgi:hypothetical protein
MNYHQKAKEKLQGILSNGKANAINLLTRLEHEIPEDYLISTSCMNFVPDHEKHRIKLQFADQRQTIHDFRIHSNARNQIIQKSGLIGSTTARKLLERKEVWATSALANLMNDVYANVGRDRVLTRTVNGEVRGFLSDRYRRLDSGPIVQSFIQESRALNAIPTEARFADTKISLTMSLPELFEPIQNEFVIIGVNLSNSDYGNGRLSLKFGLTRVFCANLCVRTEAFKQVHLGRKLDEDIAWSDKTYELDKNTMVSALSDVTKKYLSKEFVQKEVTTIKEAAEQEVDIRKLLEGLRKSNKLTKGEEESIKDKFNTPEVELLPPGANLWRASNAISLFAKEAEVPERALELQQLAGEIL